MQLPSLLLTAQKLAKGNPRFLPEEESCKEGTGRTGLATFTNNLHLQLECRKESFRAEEKPKASRKISKLIFRSVLRLFTVRFAHSLASFAGLPGSGGKHFRFSIGLLLLRRQIVVFWFSVERLPKADEGRAILRIAARYPRLPQGSSAGRIDAKENSPRSSPLPVNFLFV